MKKVFLGAVGVALIFAGSEPAYAIIGQCSVEDRQRCMDMDEICLAENCVYACYRWTLDLITCDCKRNTVPVGGSAMCATNCYGDGSNCQSCPSAYGVAGNSPQGSTSVSDCYIPAGTTGSDSTGTFIITSDCHY